MAGHRIVFENVEEHARQRRAFKVSRRVNDQITLSSRLLMPVLARVIAREADPTVIRPLAYPYTLSRHTGNGRIECTPSNTFFDCPRLIQHRAA